MDDRKISAVNVRFEKIVRAKGFSEERLAWNKGEYVNRETRLLFEGFLMGQNAFINDAGCYVVVPIEKGRFRFPLNPPILSDSREADRRMKEAASDNPGKTYTIFTKIKSHHVKKP